MLGILNIEKLTLKQKVLVAAFTLLGVFMFGSGHAHAATLDISGGCTLNEAVNSVNGAADTGGCAASGAYGTSDTITIPAGTQTLTGDLPTITEDVVISGAGMGQTTIDGDGYSVFDASGVNLSISGLKITGYDTFAIRTTSSNVILNNIEVDGTGADHNDQNILLNNTSSSTKTITANNVYMHNIYVDDSLIYLFLVHQTGGGTTNATLSNITMANSGNTTGGMDAFALGIGSYLSLGGTGTLNATITNATLHNLSSTSLVAPYASFAFANGGPANTTVNVYNSTITGTRGVTGGSFPLVGIKSAAFYSAAAGLGSGNVGTSTVNVGNSLFADNLSDSTPSNCQSVDFTTAFSGTGTGTSTVNSNGYNISDDASCTSFTGTGDKQSVSNIISTLGPLQNNGGVVPTRALLLGSPAISSGGAVLGVSTDARGIARPADCPSVGAYQYVGAACISAAGSLGGGAGSLANTGQNTKASMVIGTFMISSALVLTIIKRNATYKRR